MLETAVAIQKLLLVEDDEASIKAAQAAFPALVVARTPAELEQALQGGEWDAIVSELDLNGVAILPLLKTAGVPIVAVTDRPPAEAALQALKAGVVDYLSKPVDWAQLQTTLHEQVATHRHNGAAHALREALRDVTRFLHHLETLSSPLVHAGVLRQVLNVAILAAEADGGWLFLAEKGHLVPAEAMGYPLPAGDDASVGLFKDAFRTRREQCIGLAGDEDPAGLASFERDKSSLLAVPLIQGQRVLGVLELARAKGKSNFRPDHVTMLSQLSRLAAVVVQAYRQEEQGTRLMTRTLQRVLAAHEEKSGHAPAEVAAAVHKATQAVLSVEERDDHELVEALRGIRALGGGHLDFWKDTLVRYLKEQQRR